MKKVYLSILASVIFSLAFFRVSGQPPTVSITGTPCANSTLTLNSSVLPTKIVWSYNSTPLSTATNSWQANSQTLVQVGQVGGIPIGVCVDGSGNLYYSDGGLMTVNKLAPGATSPVVVAGVSGSAGAGLNQLKQPAGICIDAAGNIYVAEEGNNRVTKWAPGATAGIIVAGTGVQGSGLDQLSDPRSVFVDASGNIYIAEGGNNRVMKWAPGATSGTMVAGTGIPGNGLNQLKGPNAAVADAAGNVYIADGDNNRVMKWAPSATAGTIVAGTGSAGSGPNELNKPTGITIDGLGNLYIGDANNNRIQFWAPSATSGVTIAGGNGAGGGPNQLNSVAGVAIDSSSNLFVADFYNDKVKEFPAVINNTITSNLPGTYTATVTINTGNIATTLPFTVNPPPAIATQPTDHEVCAGTNTQFAVSTSGGPVASYQWQLNTGNNIYTNLTDGGHYSGATAATLTVVNPINSMSGYKYVCVITGVCPPQLTTNAAKLTVDTLPVIVTQPSSSTICAGNNTSFTTTASGTGISYQWFVRQGTGNFSAVSNGGVYGGATSSTLTITNAPATMNGYTYHCVVTGICSPIAQTNDVLLTVNTSPVIITQANNDTVCAGSNAVFSITTTGTNPVYQWKINTGSGFTNISNGGIYSGANSSTLIISPTSTSMSGYQYECFVSGTCTPPVTSNAAVLRIDTLPSITSQPPRTGIICENTNTSFTVGAAGTGLSYQWQTKQSGNFINLSNNATFGGVTTNTLAINNGSASLSGNQFRLIVSGSCTPAVISDTITLSVNTAPALSQQPSLTTACEHSTTSFSVSATGSNINYQWQIRTGSNPFTDLVDTGIYSGSTTSTLTITDVPLALNAYTFRVYINGTCAPAIVSNGGFLIVNPTPAPTIVAGGPTTICPYDSVIFSTGFVPGYHYQWVHGSGNTPILNQTSTQLITRTADNYSVKVTNTYNCSAYAPSVSVIVKPQPQVVISHPGPLCSDRNEVLYASYDATWVYQWGYDSAINNTFSPTPITGATNSNYTANNTGRYTVLVTNSVGCSTVPAYVTIYQSPTAEISRSGTLTTCSGDTVDLNSSGADLSYQWLVNGAPDPINGNQINYTAHIGAPGVSYYAVVVASNGCTDTSATLAVTAKPLPPAAITLFGPATLCNNTNIALQANAPALNHVLFYQWQYNGADVNGAVYPTFLASAVGTYTLKTDDLSGCYGTASINISSDAPFTPTVTYNNGTLCADNNPIYTFYQWSLNGNAISGANSQCYTPLADGPYTVTVKDTAGCSNTSAATTVTNVGVVTVSIKDAVKVYPNPASNFVHIDAPVKVNVTIMSLEGRVILQQNAAKNIDLSTLANGVYIMGIYDTDNTLIKNERLVKTGL